MNYSKLRTLRVKNFRNLGDVTIDFTKSAIIALYGDNESGKTSVVKAFKVLTCNDSPKSQKGYIRTGTETSVIASEFEDNSFTYRELSVNDVNRLTWVEADKTKSEYSKLSEGYPKEVLDRWGLLQEPETGEYLQIRTYEDQLMFVTTPPSANRKLFYNALKVDNITNAIKIATDDINKKNNEQSANNSKIAGINMSLEKIAVHDVSQLIPIKDTLSGVVDTCYSLVQLVEMIEAVAVIEKQLTSIRVLEEYNVQAIDEGLAYRLNEANKSINLLVEMEDKLNGIKEINTLQSIDTTYYDKLTAICGSIGNLSVLEEKCKMYECLSDIQPIDYSVVNSVSKLMNIQTYIEELPKYESKINDDINTLNSIDTSKAESLYDLITKVESLIEIESDIGCLSADIAELTETIKHSGAAIEICPRCGEEVIVDIHKYEEH